MARMVLWVVIVLMVLDNMGVNITTLVASLGVGGIAVALAVQNVLGDLFASLSIVLDKPFVVGDSITVGESTGTVEYIGVKTTRLRALTGEQIVFSNAEMLKSVIHNQQRMVTRRASFVISVTYDTSGRAAARHPGHGERDHRGRNLTPASTARTWRAWASRRSISMWCTT